VNAEAKQRGQRYVGNLLDALAIVAIALASGTLTIMLRLDKQAVASTASIEQHERSILAIVATVKSIGESASAQATRLTIMETSLKTDRRLQKSIDDICHRLSIIEEKANK
jgi:hypothetical protein